MVCRDNNAILNCCLKDGTPIDPELWYIVVETKHQKIWKTLNLNQDEEDP